MNFKDSPKQGELLDSRILKDYTYFTVKTELHKLSNNNSFEFVRVEAPNWVSIVPISDENKFQMIWQYRPAWRRASLEFPAGRLDGPEEPFLTAAKRELREETGYEAENWNLIGECNPVTWTSQAMNVFSADGLTFVGIDPDPEEDIFVVEVSESEIQNHIKNKDIIDGPSLLSYYLYKNHLLS